MKRFGAVVPMLGAVVRSLVLSSLVLCALVACGSGPMRRVSEPAASIQQLTVQANGSWSIQLRLNNYSSVPYTLHGSVDAAPEDGGPHSYDIERSSALSPVPGLPGVLR